MSMRWSRVAAVVAWGLLSLLGGPEHAQAAEPAKTPSPAAAPKAGWDAATERFRHPTDWLDLGADLRIRDEYGDNIYTVDDSGAYNYTNWVRYRSRFWAKLKAPNKDLDLNARMTNEFRTYQNVPNSRTDKHTDSDEALLDNLNVTARQVGGLPLTAVLGRQDIMLGENWLVLDGTPLDGSRTTFFDALRFTYDWTQKNLKLDFIYIDMAASTDRWLKPIHDRDRFLTEQDEQGLITYLTYKPSKTQQVEGYFIYRSDDVPSGTSTNMPAAWAQQADLYTLGGAWTRQIDDHWSYRIEGAVQQGNRNGRDLEAFGTNNRLTYAFKDEYQNTLRLGYEYVTGDDPDSADEDEQFDMLWGEWPRWSELYIYTYTKEGQVAENSNLHRIGIGHTFYPHKKLQVKSDYMALWADQDSGLGGDNKFRGHLLTCWMIYTHNAHIRGHLLGELLIPGDYYATDDNALFLRAQVELIF